MAEIRNKQTLKPKKRGQTAQVIANLSGYSSRHVRLVMEGKRTNNDLLDATIYYEQEHSALIEQVKELVPIKRKKISQN